MDLLNSKLRLPRAAVLATMFALLTACGGEIAPDSNPPIDTPTETPVDLPAETPDEQNPEAAGCSTPNHLALTDVESVTDWINALPQPLELPCFLESLPRPFYVNMTESVFSAQPSNGKRNPRIFIFYDRLVLSVVPQESFSPEEEHINLLEISFNTEGSQSVKAEILFPVMDTLAYSDAYLSAAKLDAASSVCGVCHRSEVKVGSFDGIPVFQSSMIRPYDGIEVTIAFLKNELSTCDEELQPHRCDMLKAIIGEGDIFWRDFPVDIPQFR